MDTLEILYENKIQASTFLERKIKITEPFTILVGPKLSGKSYLIYDYIQNEQKEYLYIDINDLKDLKFDSEKLQNFINEKDIKILVIENYDYSFNLPIIESIIISTNIYKHINKFAKLEVMPLDFEEYLSFDIKHQNTTNSFNSFLKYGNIAELIDYKDNKKQNRNKEIIQLINQNNTSYKILELLIRNTSLLKSTFWLYNELKKTMKISKDFFYKQIKEFEQNNTIIFCPKYNSQNTTKKLFIYNHAFMHSVSFNKNFNAVFSNMIFLEIYSRYKDVCYYDKIDFYIPSSKTIILVIPFYINIQLASISAKILSIKDYIEFDNINIVTISNQHSLYIDDIPCEVIPFYEWALGL